jgi:ATP-dependent helicase HepA
MKKAKSVAKILALRNWLGEHYRLFHRLLRNRREDPSAWLFPGLAGLNVAHWSVKPEDVTLDELLEDWRSSAKILLRSIAISPGRI